MMPTLELHASSRANLRPSEVCWLLSEPVGTRSLGRSRPPAKGDEGQDSEPRTGARPLRPRGGQDKDFPSRKGSGS